MKSSTRFRFPLATLLKVSRLRQEAARARLSQAEARVAASRQALADTQNLLAQRLAGLGGDTPRVWTAEELRRRLHYLEHLTRALAGWRERLAQDEAEADQERQVLLHHHRQTRLLEHLRDRAWARFRRELERRQSQETEATVLARFPRETED